MNGILQVMQHLAGKSNETYDLQLIDVSMVRMKGVGADWLVQMADYIGQNPLFLVNWMVKIQMKNG